MPVSGETRVRMCSPLSLPTILKPLYPPPPVSSSKSTASIRASGGASRMSSSRNCRSSVSGPSSSSSAPSELLRTQPASPCRRTSLWTKGRKPTPCTIPLTSMRNLANFSPITLNISHFLPQACHSGLIVILTSAHIFVNKLTPRAALLFTRKCVNIVQNL